MAFVLSHHPLTAPTTEDLCFVIQGDRLLGRLDAAGGLQLPTVAVLTGLARDRKSVV